MRRVVVVLAVSAAVLGGCGRPSRPTSAGNRAPSAPPPPVSTAATRVTSFTPYAASGALTVTVDAYANGRCWTASIEVPVAGAYRCLVGADIADPCFAQPKPKPRTPATVACLADPWSGARVVTLTQPLPSVDPLGDPANPWAVQLANGARCVAATGTVPIVGGVALNLRCPGGMVAGGLDRSGPRWHVKYGPLAGTQLSSVDVAAAWRG